MTLLGAMPFARCSEQKLDIEYGPFLSATFVSQWPRGSYTFKGIAVRLDDSVNNKEAKEAKERGVENDFRAGVIFDTDLLRVSAGWAGAQLKLQGVQFDMQHGVNPEIAKGAQVFGTRAGPGWAKAGDFNDPRRQPFGPLPAEWAKYKGLYRSGNRVVFSYTVGKCAVLESHSFDKDKGIFFREFTVEPCESPLEVLICETESSDSTQFNPATMTAAIEEKESETAAKLFGAPAGVEFSFPKGTAISVKIPASQNALNFKVGIWSGPKNELEKLAQAAATAAVDLKTLCKGGPILWPLALTGEGKLGTPSDAFAVDTIPILESKQMRPTGFDFFSDGRAAVCTLNGDVWIVSGLDADLKKVFWRRFASGLFQPLGLKIVNDQIYVVGRDQITRLKDLGATGEADFYENFNNDTQVTQNFHEFAMDLQTDAAGNFYFCKAGPVLPGGKGFGPVLAHHGCVLKVSPDGSKLEVVATGLRAANGMSIGPNGEITASDQEGTWVPSSRVNLIKPGGFYGCPPLSHTEPPPKIYNPPICWIPHNTGIDNSSGGQVWVTGGKWGPLEGSLLHLSYGQSALFLTMYEMVDGIPQGGVVRFPLQFKSGIMRARFNPRDGQLYVCGLQGWQTTGIKFGCFQRVRYVGGTVHMPSAIHVTKDSIAISFYCPLEKCEPDDFSIEQWNYRWTEKYGSEHYAPSTPNKEGTFDTPEVKAVQLSSDKKTVTLQIPNLKPVMQMKIKYTLKAADGVKMKNQEIYNTINVVPQ